MAAKPKNLVTEQMIVADWRTGEYSQQDLADKYKISKGKANNLCKGVERDMSAIVTAVTAAVDSRTIHILLFND